MLESLNMYERILFDIFLTIIGLAIIGVVSTWATSFIVDQLIDLSIIKDYSKEVREIPAYDDDITTG